MNGKVSDLLIISLLSAILFVQEQILSFIPNFQLTVFLIILYSKTLGSTKTLLIILIHVLLDNLYMGSLSTFYTPVMLVGWSFIPITINSIFGKINSNLGLGFLSIFYAVFYCLLYSVVTVWITKMDLGIYLLGDLPFTVILASSSFLSVVFLYVPCNKVLYNLNK